MYRLTREVRFGIGADRAIAPDDGTNAHAGRPGLSGLGHYVELRVTLAGEPDADSGYLRDIKDVDRQVRRRAVPLVRDALATPDDQRLVRRLADALADAWPGAAVDGVSLRVSPYLGLAWHRTEPDMVRLAQRFEFSAAHRLHNPALSDERNRATFGKCNNPHGHGHNYEVEVVVAGEPGPDGVLLPVGELERIVDEAVVRPMDHTFLNVEVPEFRDPAEGGDGLNPSVEHIARVCYRRLAPRLPGPRARLASVTVWETPKTWCEYAE